MGIAQAAYDFTVQYLRGEAPGTPPVKRRMYPTKQLAVANMHMMLEQTKAVWFQAIAEAGPQPEQGAGAAGLYGAIFGDGEFQRTVPDGDPHLRRTIHAQEPAAGAALPGQPLRRPDAAVDGGDLSGPPRPRSPLQQGRGGRVSDDISGWIETHAGFTPDKVALKHVRGEETYAEFADQVRTHAPDAQAPAGAFGRGDRIAYLGPNTRRIPVPVLRRGPAGGPCSCPSTGAWRRGSMRTFCGTRAPKRCSATMSISITPRGSGLISRIPPFVDCRGTASRFGWHLLEEELALAEGDDRNPHVDAGAPFLLVYTSGTTGRPKGAVLTQEAIHYNALNCVHAANMRSDDNILVSIPPVSCRRSQYHADPGFLLRGIHRAPRTV